jgi:hypothetical protein
VLYPENGGYIDVRNVGNYKPDDRALHPGRLQSARTSPHLWEHRNIKVFHYVKKRRKHVLSTIVQMLDVITSFNFNCYSSMMD